VSTSNQGEERACIQCGYCFDICPVQIMPSLLVKASIINNIEKMESMHIHDCIECELCTFICPAKIEIGQHIKNGKDFIKKEG
jgi:Na+-translocating ferredoxin:NAD+ oxidoreductase RnfC subunit